MRLWSLHPRYLDPQGLTAAWREGLLARAVLRGETRGYRNHPQLDRFRAHASPRQAINAYLAAIHAESVNRDYRFDASKLGRRVVVAPIPVTRGQVAFEWARLLEKLAARSPVVHARWASLARPQCHPLFKIRAGGIEPWERP